MSYGNFTKKCKVCGREIHGNSPKHLEVQFQMHVTFKHREEGKTAVEILSKSWKGMQHVGTAYNFTTA